MNSKLVLFDIDGTLIYHCKTHHFEDQYEVALKKVFGVEKQFDLAVYNGTLDRENSWAMVRESGISRREFLKKFPLYVQAMKNILAQRGSVTRLYEPIPDAVSLIKKMSRQSSLYLGIITGNAESIADWKLEHTGLAQYFRFGLFGDEADNRAQLAGKVFGKAGKELGRVFSPEDITVIGDTVYDIRCGKAIGATTVGVTTGMHGNKDILLGEHPDLVVDSLLDPRILTLFSLA